MAKAKPQNVLFIIVDDLGWNDLGYMGSEYYESPNIDRLANSGVVFTDAYAACSVSSPSRASVVSGLYTPNHGVTKWISKEGGGGAYKLYSEHARRIQQVDYVHYIREELTLMPELLRDNGYSTFFAGKWHLGEEEKYWPDQQGFEINKGGWASGGPVGGYFAPYKNPRLEDGPDGENLSMRLAEETVSFMKNHQKSGSEKPFFAYLSFYAVHSGIESDQCNWKYFRDKAEKMGIAETGYVMEGEMPNRQYQDNPIYAGLIKLMDDAVGRVLDSLEEMGLDEDTVVIFTSDNGGTVTGDAFATSLKPLRAGKGHQYEGGIRVPFIVRDPNSKMNGKSSSVPVNGIDIYPTVMSYTGVKVPKSVPLDGVDISPIMKGKSLAERPMFWHVPHYSNLGGAPGSIIRRGDWKLIYWHEEGNYELFNLKEDIGETTVLNDKYPAKVEELKGELMAWLKETNAKMPEADPLFDPTRAEELIKHNSTVMLKAREAERKKMLDPNYVPNSTWWGSQPVAED